MATIRILTPAAIDLLRADHRRLAALAINQRDRRPELDFPESHRRSFWVKNESGEEVPAFGVMRFIDTEIYRHRVIYRIGKPSTTPSRLYLPNNAQTIPDNAVRRIELPDDDSFTLLYDDESAAYTPAALDGLGPKPGTWKLARRYPQTSICKGRYSEITTDKLILATLTEIVEMFVAADSLISKGGSGTVSVYAGLPTTLAGMTDTGQNITAYSPYVDFDPSLLGQLNWPNGIPTIHALECV